MRQYVIGLATILVGVIGAASAGAQDAERPADNILQQQRTIDNQLADARRDMAPLESLLDWQWGGWLEYYAFHYDDGVQSSRWYHRPGLSLWTRITIDDSAHEIFARMKLSYDYFRSGDEYDRQQDWVGPNLDRGWYQVDVGKALRLTTPADPYQMKIRIGRQETLFGTGYVLDQPLDAVTFDARLHDIRVRGLFGHAIGSTPNIDRSDPVDSHSARRFFGAQVSYVGFERHEPFVYALWNDDYTDERPEVFFQEYAYDTQYFGIGSRGEIIHNLGYWIEGVIETGKSYGEGQFLQRDDVSAWGLDAGLEYLLDVRTRPRVAVEYMFASGDDGRIGSPSSAEGGNRWWSGDDQGFNGFGYRDTGISAAPALSNIHIVRLGGSFVPFEDVDYLRDLELGTNWFYYHKHQARGAISDPEADMFRGYVGWEMDYFLNWRLTSDLSWTVRWGAFFPGSAYSDRDMRNFVFTGVTWSF